MQTEIEVKFLRANHDELRHKLKELGAELVHAERLMRRKNFDYPDMRLEKEAQGWVRVRDEGSGCTMSYKQMNDRTLHGTKEVNLKIDDFDMACTFLETIGLQTKSYQETKRESWLLDGVQIELDEWPWAPSYIELEGPSEPVVQEVAAKLGYDMAHGVHGSVEIVYQDVFNVTEKDINTIKIITFSEVPSWLEQRRKV